MKVKLLLLMLLVSVFSWGQMTFTSGAGLTQTQNFDGLPTNTTSNIINTARLGHDWFRSDGTTQSQALTANIIVGQNTSSTAHGMYNCGVSAATTSTDRAVGGVASGTAQHRLGVRLVNNVGTQITQFNFDFKVEKYRNGSSNTVTERVLFEYSTDATSLNTGSWAAISALDLVEPSNANTDASVGIDGNETGNFAAISGSITGLTLANSSGIWIRWRDTDATGADAVLALDDVSITAITTVTPTLTVSETALTAMDYIFGSGPSTPAKTFTVAGSSLAPVDAADRYVYIEPTGTNFEFSLDNSTFYTAGEIIPFPTGDGFLATTVYVRLKAGLAVGTYTDATTITYYNAPTADLVINIALSGAVNAAATTVTTTAITGSPFCVTATAGASVSVPFTSTGTFTGNTYTAQLSSASGSFASPTSIGTLVSIANSGTISATIPANTATGTAYRIRVIASNPSTTGSNNGTNLIINLANSSIAPTANQTIPIGVNGNTLTVTETSTPTSRVWKYGTTIGSYTTTTASTGLTYLPNFATAGTYYVVCESTFVCGTLTSNYVTITVNTPVITVTGTPTLFTYAQGQGPSAYQTLNVSGTSLTDNITITVPTAYWELSTNIAFSSPSATITLTKNASTHVVSLTSVYVRLKEGLSQGFYEIPTDTDFVATSTNAVTRTADLDGQVTTPVPFINVEGNIGAFPDITPVTNTPSSLDNTLFAQQTVGASQTKSFRIQNLGGLPLTISSVTIIGANPLDFTVTTPPPSTIAAGATVTFDVTFSPTSFGVRSTIVSIANNSSNITPNFDFNVQGTGNNPEIAVTGSGNAIPSGSTATSATNNTYLGNANGNPANPTTVSQNFVISNSGNVALNITPITITGVDASQFTVSPTTSTIAAGATGNITVTFAPTSIGVKNAIINIANNDLTDSENPYTFAVQGNAESYVTCAPSGDQILIIQNFDGTTPVWGYTVGSLTFYDFGGASSDGFWGVTTSTGGKSLASSINYTPITNNFLFLQDLQCENGDGCANTTGTGILTFDAVDISGKQNVKFSFDYDIYQFDSGDGVFYDNVSQGEVQFITGAGDLTTEGNINISIPSTVSSFHFVLKIQQNGSDAAGFDNFKIIYSQLAEKTWNGTAWSGDGLPPTSSQKAIIDGPYITATNGSFNCCSLTVNSGVGRTLTISSEFPVIVQNNVINEGIINILNNGQLIQVNETDNNSGTYNSNSFKVQRLAFVNAQDYVYWSSPVENFNVGSIPTQQRYFWNPIYVNTNGTLGNWNSATGSDATMIKGKGYIVNSGSGYPVRPIPAANLEANFVGRPNNGTLATTIQRGTNAVSIDDNWNLIGNPYPSAIFAEEFLDANVDKINGSVWVWTHGHAPDNLTDPYYDNFGYNYYATDYLKYNKLGATDTTFNGIIASGQGFMVNMLHTTPLVSESVTFTNAMRTDATATPYNNSGFFKTANTNLTVVAPEEKHRIWLNIVNTTIGQKDAALLGYSTNATLAVDHFYDCIFVPRTEVGIYTLVNTGEYVIQGRPLPFLDSDLVPMGVKIVNAGSHKIAIKKVDGLFEGNQGIYLEDTLLGIVHDLKAAPYTFTSEVGVFNSRFIVRYTTSALANEDFDSVNNSVTVSSQNDTIAIKSESELMSSAIVYDVLGRELDKKNNINANDITFLNVAALNQALIIKITLENGQVVTRKIIL